MISQNELEKLAEKVKGVQPRVAEESGVSQSLVSLVLSGKRKNTKVIDAAIKVAEELENENKIRKQKIQDL